MAIAATRPNDQPLMELNTTPLIDVLLVLLILFVITIPAATHSLAVDLPSDRGDPPRTIDPVVNRVTLTADGVIQWNGDGVSQQQLAALLGRSARMVPEPELQFAPDAQAGYDLAAHVTGTIKASGVTRFGFVGNDRYAEFGRAGR